MAGECGCYGESCANSVTSTVCSEPSASDAIARQCAVRALEYVVCLATLGYGTALAFKATALSVVALTCHNARRTVIASRDNSSAQQGSA